MAPEFRNPVVTADIQQERKPIDWVGVQILLIISAMLIGFAFLMRFLVLTGQQSDITAELEWRDYQITRTVREKSITPEQRYEKYLAMCFSYHYDESACAIMFKNGISSWDMERGSQRR